ncbi:cysteine--tRNA ligase [Candidatus Peregrinibacteria bacterium]|nr:cysteine--tRNA ligase [Candidatus Peregrinibacteria bacterium]
MQFLLQNTLSGQKETFSPKHGNQVDYYSCGPTVYNVVHIGNLRAFLNADTLYRWMKYGMKYDVRWVMNITDVDDKTIRDSQKEFPEMNPMEALLKFTRKYEEFFFRDLEILSIHRDSFYKNPRATESIPEMQELIRSIMESGIGYEKDGSIYFSLEKYTEKSTYGRLVHLNLDAMKTGSRTLADEIEKENVQDFVLWKAHKEGEPSWAFSLNGKNFPGRPGWHIECSAMSKAAFKKFPFDIHSGGVDLKFPHHEDEIAQSTAGYAEDTARFWVHNEHLLVQGKKMSKSLGNFYTLHDLMKKGFSPAAIRFFLVTNHYQTKLNLSDESIFAAKNSLDRIHNKVREIQKNPAKQGKSLKKYRQSFEDALCDDLNTPQAAATLFEALDAESPHLEELEEFLRFAEQIFGVNFSPKNIEVPEKILSLAKKRQDARKRKDWKMADELRKEIESRGYEVRDEKEGIDFLQQK